MRYLIQTTEVYRADSEPEAKELIEEAKNSREFDLAKYSSERKDIKEKKEIVGEYYKVTLVKSFTDIKEPDTVASVIYEVE